MSYKITITHRKEFVDGKQTTNDIVLNKTIHHSGIDGLEHVIQSGIITLPYKDLPKLIEDLQEYLNQ